MGPHQKPPSLPRVLLCQGRDEKGTPSAQKFFEVLSQLISQHVMSEERGKEREWFFGKVMREICEDSKLPQENNEECR